VQDTPSGAFRALSVRGATAERGRATPLAGGRTMVPLSAGGGPLERASAWIVCDGALTAEEPGRFGPVLGHVGAKTLPADVQRALDDAASSGRVVSEPWAPVIDVGPCGRAG